MMETNFFKMHKKTSLLAKREYRLPKEIKKMQKGTYFKQKNSG